MKSGSCRRKRKKFETVACLLMGRTGTLWMSWNPNPFTDGEFKFVKGTTELLPRLGDVRASGNPTILQRSRPKNICSGFSSYSTL
jgi:hypothetical protein